MGATGNIDLDTLWRRNQAQTHLLSLTTAVGASLELAEVVKASLDNTVRLLNAAAGDIAVFGLPGETRSIRLRGSDGYRFEARSGPEAPRLNREIASRAAKTGKPLILGGEKVLGHPLTKGIAGLAIIPLSARGRVCGVMTLGCPGGSGLMEADPALLEAIGQITGAAIENSRVYLRLKHVSDTDSLTGLYNHRFMMEKLDRELKRAVRYGHPLSVTMVDINRFKELNDEYGHLFGDLVLKKAALALASACRETDFVGRYGGDEFMVILPETGAQEADFVAERAAERIAWLQLKKPGSATGFVRVTAAHGTSDYPFGGRGAREVIAAADKKLYALKRARPELADKQVPQASAGSCNGDATFI